MGGGLLDWGPLVLLDDTGGASVARGRVGKEGETLSDSREAKNPAIDAAIP